MTNEEAKKVAAATARQEARVAERKAKDNEHVKKTIREYLAELPGEYGKRALANMKKNASSIAEVNAADALADAFGWEESPEGLAFWSGVYDSLDSDATLPSLEGLPPMRSTGE